MTSNSKQTHSYFTLALRNVVVCPHSVMALYVKRAKSIATLQKAVDAKEQILVLTQKDHLVEDPQAEDLYAVGTLASITQLVELPDGSLKVVIKGLQRIKVTASHTYTPFLCFYGEPLQTLIHSTPEIEASRRLLLERLEQYLSISNSEGKGQRKLPAKKDIVDLLSSMQQVEDTETLVDLLTAQLPLDLTLQQRILDTESLEDRLEALLVYLEKEMEIYQVQKTILSRVQKNVSTQQRKYLEDIKKQAILEEFGNDDLATLRERIENTPLSSEARAKAEADFQRLQSMNPMTLEASVLRTYLETVVSLPWTKESELDKDLAQAAKVLEEEHYGLEKIKKKILEFLAVQNRTGRVQGNILCFVGPPGVGKTALAQSIARATGRKLVTLALGGVRDEAEIRGHRRTYVGAMPGGIIKQMIRAGTDNPLFLLDEVDKMGKHFTGDPAAAMLEVLDPNQNKMFHDHYLDFPYDLSKVFFVCTANVAQNIPEALLNRMEVIYISGYTEEEKMEIATRHLIPHQRKDCGLKEGEFQISTNALHELIRSYCREAGVRKLNRMLRAVMSKAVALIDDPEEKVDHVHVGKNNLKVYAGTPQYTYGEAALQDRVGVTTGLAWTEAGGDIMFIEVAEMDEPRKGNITITGNLGEVMKESVRTALSCIRSKAVSLGIMPTRFENDMHVHVPAGAVPKDGPSAGIAICVSIVSALTGIPVRAKVAMTGEVSLVGEVLPIGGLKEKILAALQARIKTVLIPKGNEKDADEIPAKAKKELEIIWVSTIEEVLCHALVNPPACSRPMPEASGG